MGLIGLGIAEEKKTQDVLVSCSRNLPVREVFSSLPLVSLVRFVVNAFNHRAIKRIPANNNDARMNPTARSTAAIGVLRKTDIVASSFPCFSATC